MFIKNIKCIKEKHEKEEDWTKIHTKITSFGSCYLFLPAKIRFLTRLSISTATTIVDATSIFWAHVTGSKLVVWNINCSGVWAKTAIWASKATPRLIKEMG